MKPSTAIAELNAQRAINLVAAEYRIPRETLLAKTPLDRRTTVARAIAMTLCYRGGMKQGRIGELFGGKSQNRVTHAISSIEKRCASNPKFVPNTHDLIRSLFFGAHA